LSLLNCLPARERELLVQRCTRLRFERGAYLFHAGEAGDALHLITKGRVAVQAGIAGDPIILEILGRDDVVGELSIISEAGLRTATVQALEATETLRLRRTEFDELRRNHPAVERMLVELLAGQVRRLTATVHELVNVPASTRVYRRLVRLAELYDVRHDGGVVPVTQEQLGRMAGARPRRVTDVLAEARAAGVLTTGNRRITIDDWGLLQKRARLDATPAW
jgi:CRP-like cAMP-binding protein